jgi:outer membrane protein TolC
MSFRSLLISTLVAGVLLLSPLCSTRAQELLTLEAAQSLALESQPLLEGQAARAQALRERSISAGELPDPELEIGVNELPVNGADAWSIERDSDTDLMIGVSQSLPRAAKRRLQQRSGELAAATADLELEDLERRIRRDAGLAWLEVYFGERSSELLERQVEQAALQRQSEEIRLRSNASAQSELLAVTVEEQLLRDDLAEARQMLQHSRLQLRRWIGDAAERPISPELPQSGDAPAIGALAASLRDLPAIKVEDRAREGAQTALELAREARKPDWKLALGYGYRPEFSEMITVRVSVGLPFFTRNRQDRDIAAAHQELREADAERADRLREFEARAALAHHDGTVLAQRAREINESILPIARARVDAADAAYRTGHGSLADVLRARRSSLEVELRGLRLAVESLRNRLGLEYFVVTGAQS